MDVEKKEQIGPWSIIDMVTENMYFVASADIESGGGPSPKSAAESIMLVQTSASIPFLNDRDRTSHHLVVVRVAAAWQDERASHSILVANWRISMTGDSWH